MSHFYLPCGNYQWLGNPSASDFPNIQTVEENGPQGWFFKVTVKYLWNFMTR
jgi:hypothetical protein